jgi:hypothetical protein
MVLRPVAGLALLLLSSCAAVQNNATIALTGGVGDVSRAQAVSNLGKMLDRKGFAPNAVTLTTGSVQTQQGVSAGANIPIGDQNTIGTTIVAGTATGGTTTLLQPQKGLTFGASGQLQENWTVAPVVDDMVLARIRALYEFETSLRDPPDASNDLLARYPISILIKEISVPRVSGHCVSQMVSAGIARNDASKACLLANGVAIIRYPDPQAVDFPNCAVCEVINPDGTPTSVSGMALKRGGSRGDTCFEVDPAENASVRLPLSADIVEPEGTPAAGVAGRTVRFARNCRLSKWLKWSDTHHAMPQWPVSVITDGYETRNLGPSEGHQLYEIADSTSDPFGDFLEFISHASQKANTAASSPNAASSSSKSSGTPIPQ